MTTEDEKRQEKADREHSKGAGGWQGTGCFSLLTLLALALLIVEVLR